MHELSITVAGNLVRDARIVASDPTPRANFRLAFNARRWDPDVKDWADGPAQYYEVWCRARLAENVAACLRKGMPVIVRGKLVVREVEVDGQGGPDRRTYVGIDAHHVGIDLARSSGRPPAAKSAAVAAAEERAVAEVLSVSRRAG